MNEGPYGLCHISEILDFIFQGKEAHERSDKTD